MVVKSTWMLCSLIHLLILQNKVLYLLAQMFTRWQFFQHTLQNHTQIFSVLFGRDCPAFTLWLTGTSSSELPWPWVQESAGKDNELMDELLYVKGWNGYFIHLALYNILTTTSETLERIRSADCNQVNLLQMQFFSQDKLKNIII